jgi:hypothetical protein
MPKGISFQSSLPSSRIGSEIQPEKNSYVTNIAFGGFYVPYPLIRYDYQTNLAEGAEKPDELFFAVNKTEWDALVAAESKKWKAERMPDSKP